MLSRIISKNKYILLANLIFFYLCTYLNRNLNIRSKKKNPDGMKRSNENMYNKIYNTFHIFASWAYLIAKYVHALLFPPKLINKNGDISLKA